MEGRRSGDLLLHWQEGNIHASKLTCEYKPLSLSSRESSSTFIFLSTLKQRFSRNALWGNRGITAITHFCSRLTRERSVFSSILFIFKANRRWWGCFREHVEALFIYLVIFLRLKEAACKITSHNRCCSSLRGLTCRFHAHAIGEQMCFMWWRRW